MEVFEHVDFVEAINSRGCAIYREVNISCCAELALSHLRLDAAHVEEELVVDHYVVVIALHKGGLVGGGLCILCSTCSPAAYDEIS